VQPGKSYRAVQTVVRTVEFNWRTSENPYVISSIEASLKSAGWRSKLVIFHTCPTVNLFMSGRCSSVSHDEFGKKTPKRTKILKLYGEANAVFW
jgi:hypothetical protein